MAHGTVLVVDDEPQLRALLRRVLEAQGYHVLLAENGLRALEILASDTPVDLLLTDMVMPGLSGRMLIDRAASLRPGLPIVLMSGYADISDTRYVLSERKLPLLPKPFDRESVARMIQSALDARTDACASGGNPDAQH